MKTRTAGRAQQVGLAFALALLACGAAMASDVERQIPVTRDTDGSGMAMEISREGTRQTATPFLTLNDPSVQRIEERIVKKINWLGAKEIPSEATVADSAPGICPTGTTREDSGRPETSLSSLPPVPEEITVRSVKNFLKELRASRKEKPAPAVVVAPPDQRLGIADASPH
jgi:hypothetical protein